MKKEPSTYDKQANDFLDRNGLKFRATLSDTKAPAWKEPGEKSGHHYRVTLSRTFDNFNQATGVQPPSRLVFDFWGSIADAENGRDPSAYDVLACISGDSYCADQSFAEWCGDYGEDVDSIRALQTFRRCSAFAKRLRAFFTEAELEQLSEIQ
jgi:hypothetical protein